MTFPTPTGAAPGGAAALVSLNNQSEAYYQSVFTSHWGAQAGQAYAAFNAANPQDTPYQNAQVFIARILAQGLASAIASVGGLVGQVPGAVADAASNTTAVKAAGAAWDAATAIPRFLSMLTSGNLWIRVGEVVAGLILLGIGVNALFRGKPMAAVTGAAGKVAPLAMA
jgi:hypothetical protein